MSPTRGRVMTAAALVLAAPGCDGPPDRARAEPPAVAELRLVTTIVSSDTASFNAADVGVGPGTQIFILDSEAWQVVVFDSSGRLVDRFGREGSGPGEIRVAKDLEVDEHGTIAVADVGNGRIGFWTSDGRWLGQSTLRRWVHDLAWNPSGLFAKEESAEGLLFRRVVRDDSGGTGAAGALLPRRLIDSSSMNWEFAPVEVDFEGRGLFAYPDSAYAVVKTDSTGRIVTTFRRVDVERVAYSAREREVIELRFRQAAARRPGLPMGATPEFKQFVLDIAVGTRGRLWILRSTPDGAAAEMDLFAPDGSYLSTVSIRPPARRIEMQGKYLIAFGESDSGESVVSLYTY